MSINYKDNVPSIDDILKYVSVPNAIYITMETKAHYQLAYCDHCGDVSSADISGGNLSCSRCNGKLALYKIDPDMNEKKLLSKE